MQNKSTYLYRIYLCLYPHKTLSGFHLLHCCLCDIGINGRNWNLQDDHGGGQRAAGGPGQPPPGEADREHRLHDHQPRAPADGLGGGGGRWRPPASPDLATDQPRVAAAALVTSNLVGGPAGLAALLPVSVSSRTSGQDPASPPSNALTGNAWMW